MEETAMNKLVFFVNGRKVEEPHADPRMTLLAYLRTKLGLCGTKLGCGEGGCGACTVMVSHFDHELSKVVHRPVNACLAPVCSVADMAVTTVEGIGSTKTRLHPVQERIAKAHGSQCGFCTPGIVMSMYTLLRNHPEPSAQEIEDAFDGNLCRCTGYRAILEGFQTFASRVGCGSGACCRDSGAEGSAAPTPLSTATPDSATQKGCCRGGDCSAGARGTGDRVGTGGCGMAGCCQTQQSEDEVKTELVQVADFQPLGDTQEPIFPPELTLQAQQGGGTNLHFSAEGAQWFRPVTLAMLLHLKTVHPEAPVIVGNTEIGVEAKFKHVRFPCFIAATHVRELQRFVHTSEGLEVGAGLTLTSLQVKLEALCATLPQEQTFVFRALLENLRWFAGPQIRSVASVGGNIATATSISDLNPIWIAARATIKLVSEEGGARVLPMSEFFIDYRRTALRPDEVIKSVFVPALRPREYVEAFKQSRRREDDLATANAGMRVLLDGEHRVVEVSLVYGGVNRKVISASNTEKALVGLRWDEGVVRVALSTLPSDIQLPFDAPGGMVEFRRTLTATFFFKFYLMVLARIQATAVPARDLTATERFHRPLSTATHLYEAPLVGEPGDTIGQPIPHLAAEKQASGEAVYLDDIPRHHNELYGALVFSTQAHARIKRIHSGAATDAPGVFAFYTATNVPGDNHIGAILHDEEIFASTEVFSVGQVIGIVVAYTQAHAQEAARLVKVDYEPLPAVLTIEQAIDAKSFFVRDRILARGSVDEGMAEAEHVFSGEVRMGGQEHFYMETQAVLCVPREDEMEVVSSTQAVAKTQTLVASALGIPAHRVTARVKRMGGGFGGKETRSCYLACAVAVAAHASGRPVRCMLDRNEDMASSGGRHPFLGRYKVGVRKDGTITALDVTLYNNAGWSLDLSGAVLDRALFHIDNCYDVPNLRVTGFCCKTNLPTNTAFRGFGGPQGMFVSETILDDVAHRLGLNPTLVRERNFYGEGSVTHYGQLLEGCQLQSVWNTLKTSAQFQEREAAVAAFNAAHRWTKRGLAMVPTKFGIAFTATFMNQSAALVHVHTDGSVLLAHGGTEMGQGLHTKMAQVCARALQIPLSQVHISETSTATIANAPPTAASASSDLNGMAILHACRQITERLQPYRDANPKGTFVDHVKAAFFDRANLSAHGFYKTPDIGFDWDLGRGRPFNYFCYGAAAVEVELDVLTGDHSVRRADLMMDVGASLNPAIDIGQVEGAFAQGYGLFAMEEVWFSPQGQLRTSGPGTYKIPSFKDIPLEMHVSLLRNAPNARAVHSSKAVGEPPLFLGSAVYFALKEAVFAARSEEGHSSTAPLRLDSPATAERLRMACADRFTAAFPAAPPGTARWNVIV